MKPNSQKTIVKEGAIAGIGIRTGEMAKVFFRPAPVDSGVRFYKNGSSHPLFFEGDENGSGEVFRCTTIGRGRDRIQTVEHLLAALSGLGLSNIEIHVEGPEIPILDGSAAPLVNFIKTLGECDQKKELLTFTVREPVFFGEARKSLCLLPAESFSVAYILDYDHPQLQFQIADFTVDPGVFEREIAPARTFCTEDEVEFVRKNGYARGASAENTLVISKNGPVHGPLRFENECARHKVLDILGDLSLLGCSLLGRVIGLRSGHALNHRLVAHILKQREQL